MQEFNPISTPVSPEVTPQIVVEQPKQSSFLVILLSSLLFISVVITGFFVYQTQKLVKELTMLKTEEKMVIATTEPTVEPISTQASEVDPTANWKTYKNDSGFSINYPTDFTNKTTGFSINKEADNMSNSLFIYKLNSINSYDERYVNIDIVAEEPSYDQGIIIQFVLNGYQAKKISLSSIPFDVYSVSNNKGKFIEIYVSNEPTKKDVANKILSTFKFTN